MKVTQNSRPGTMPAQGPRPVVALALGDPAGIGAELAASMAVDPQVRAACDLVLIGDLRLLEAGARVAGVSPDVEVVAPGGAIAPGSRPLLIDMANVDPATIHCARVTKAGGAAALANFRVAIGLGQAGAVDAVTFTPFNKASMRMAYPAYEDEIVYVAEVTGFTGTAREFNILEGLWNARLTSHVPLSAVAGLITAKRVEDGLLFTDQAMREAGFEKPRIAVAGLNPHAGDNGNFGREEIDVIAPAVEKMKAAGIACDGPYPSDTVFVRARRGDFDAVLTMYHDQGQIAMKLIGFDEGVSLLGGFPVPICTPAHGTAFDIAGKGIAHPGATRNALLIAARMGAARRRAASATRPSLSAEQALAALAA
jgi:4-hydroxythreonine-4-phosphate dehydrogenase